MELDTGASVSITFERDYNAKFKEIKVKNNGLKRINFNIIPKKRSRQWGISKLR